MISNGHGENRRLELEFVIPNSERIANLEAMQQSPPRPPRMIDAVVNPPTSVPIVQPRKPGSWMD